MLPGMIQALLSFPCFYNYNKNHYLRQSYPFNSLNMKPDGKLVKS